ncbi:MAG TPA: glutamate formimidoyltransferase [Chloroflexota bacterium]|nr:glutamate formimidoyltransferase [Chloroflexota bacterium]
MAEELVECIPNFSEGRRPEVIAAIRDAVAAVSGVRILNVDSDVDHNRFVLSYVVPVSQAVASGLAAARAALEHIDLRAHQGAHPRMGALDVFPIVPLGTVSMSRCIELANELGRRIADELGIPVYLYEEAARTPERTNLEQIRKGGFEALVEAVPTDPARHPDFGPPALHPSAGAVAVGARRPLIAFNVYLGTADPRLARTIARAIRHSSGGLRYVKALGLSMPEAGVTQVSMNLTNYTGTSMVRVMDLIRAEAARWGVPVTHSEVVGLIPLDALLDAAEAFLQLHDFSRDQILERRLLQGDAS